MTDTHPAILAHQDLVDAIDHLLGYPAFDYPQILEIYAMLKKHGIKLKTNGPMEE